jgi:hypothetical protein
MGQFQSVVSINGQGELVMKKIMSTVIAAMITVSFAAVVCAAEPAKMPAGHPAVGGQPAMPAGHPPVGDAAKPAKKAKKAKKANKAAKKQESKPAEAPVAAPAAK